MEEKQPEIHFRDELFEELMNGSTQEENTCKKEEEEKQVIDKKQKLPTALSTTQKKRLHELGKVIFSSEQGKKWLEGSYGELFKAQEFEAKQRFQIIEKTKTKVKGVLEKAKEAQDAPLFNIMTLLMKIHSILGIIENVHDIITKVLNVINNQKMPGQSTTDFLKQIVHDKEQRTIFLNTVWDEIKENVLNIAYEIVGLVLAKPLQMLYQVVKKLLLWALRNFMAWVASVIVKKVPVLGNVLSGAIRGGNSLINNAATHEMFLTVSAAKDVIDNPDKAIEDIVSFNTKSPVVWKLTAAGSIFMTSKMKKFKGKMNVSNIVDVGVSANMGLDILDTGKRLFNKFKADFSRTREKTDAYSEVLDKITTSTVDNVIQDTETIKQNLMSDEQILTRNITIKEGIKNPTNKVSIDTITQSVIFLEMLTEAIDKVKQETLSFFVEKLPAVLNLKEVEEPSNEYKEEKEKTQRFVKIFGYYDENEALTGFKVSTSEGGIEKTDIVDDTPTLENYKSNLMSTLNNLNHVSNNLIDVCGKINDFLRMEVNNA